MIQQNPNDGIWTGQLMADKYHASLMQDMSQSKTSDAKVGALASKTLIDATTVYSYSPASNSSSASTFADSDALKTGVSNEKFYRKIFW